MCKNELKNLNFHFDLIKPLENGGTNESDNLQVSCKECHFEKHALNKMKDKTSDTLSS